MPSVNCCLNDVRNTKCSLFFLLIIVLYLLRRSCYNYHMLTLRYRRLLALHPLEQWLLISGRSLCVQALSPAVHQAKGTRLAQALPSL